MTKKETNTRIFESLELFTFTDGLRSAYVTWAENTVTGERSCIGVRELDAPEGEYGQ